ncbi:2-isopropylmalate synthase [Mycolicibacterium palauense]|uniref:homocitrate synthase n=1 Tax=Mycolicibacterium palauense TaxID=2034511 RepID=UPI001FE8AB3D|nr:homocitrate synthase [Mycolicibacterium palauense]
MIPRSTPFPNRTSFLNPPNHVPLGLSAGERPVRPRFADFFDAPLPRGLREIAADMSWDDVAHHFGSAPGPLRLGDWECTDGDRPSGRLGPQARNYRATLAVGDHVATATAAASGPLAALTAMLHDRGVGIEMLKFHQLSSGGHTATFVRGSDGVRDEWAIGWSACPTESALRAVISCGNRLFAHR